MKLIILSVIASFLLAAPEISAQESDGKLEIWANVSQSVKCKKNKKTAFGLYKIVINNAEASFVPLATGNKDFAAAGAGVIYGSESHFVNGSSEIYSFSTLSWKADSGSGEDVSENRMYASAAAYDTATDKVYACLTDRKGKEHNYGTISYDNLNSLKLGYNSTHYVAMAVDGEGVLYAITISGELHKIDKKSGDKVIIGNTGITPSDKVQAMAFNVNDGQMYWASAPEKGSSFLGRVNLKDASVIKVCTFADNDIISCMYIPQKLEDKAPARVYDMEVLFEGAQNKGFISFTTPTMHYDGSIISGDVEFSVIVDKKIAGPFKAKPGEKVKAAVFVEEPGMHDFKVVLNTDGFENAQNQISKWIGYDEPLPIRNLKSYADLDKTVHITWKAPRGGRHGGYVDMKNLVYRIVRHPGDLVIAEACSDTKIDDDVSSGVVTSYYYEVTPYIKK